MARASCAQRYGEARRRLEHPAELPAIDAGDDFHFGVRHLASAYGSDLLDLRRSRASANARR